MWDWKESMEHCFFTDHLDEHLKEFLNSNNSLLSDAERWEHLYKSGHEWKQGLLTDFEGIDLLGFWSIDLYFGVFVLPDDAPCCSKDILYRLFLTGWVMSDRDDSRGGTRFPNAGYDRSFAHNFQYSKKTCRWLDKQQFLYELKSVYDRSYSIFQYHKENPNPNLSQSEWTAWEEGLEDAYSRFLSRCSLFKKHLQQPQIVRLNKLKPERYIWYLIRENQTVYYIQLSEFG